MSLLQFNENFSQFLGQTWDRDKIMGLTAFSSMAAAEPIGKVTGSKSLAHALLKLSSLADGYRAVTRMSGLVDLLQPSKLVALASSTSNHPSTDKFVGVMGILEFLTALGFFPSEHGAVLTKFGVLSGGDRRFKHFSTLAVFFWFWGLLLKSVRLSYQWAVKRSKLSGGSAVSDGQDATSREIQKQLKAIQLQLVGSVSYLIFSLTCISGKARVFQNAGGSLSSSVNSVFEMLTPPHLELPLWVRGTLGVIATSVEFLPATHNK